MSKGISKIGRGLDKAWGATGKKVYKAVVPSKIRKSVSKTWQKIRKPVMTAAAIYLTAGLGAAAIGGTSIAGGFATVNSGIAAAFGGGAAGGGAAAGSGSVGAAGGAGAGMAGSGSVGTGLLTSTGGIAGTTGAAGTVSGATAVASGGNAASGAALTGATKTASASTPGFFGHLKAGNYMQAAAQGGKNIVAGAGKAWNAATANTGSAMLTSGLLQGYSANQQQKRQDRRDEEFRNRRTWYGMDGQGGVADFSQGPGLLDGVQAPQLAQSTSLDDLIKSRKQGVV